ncbi:hypothetical protein LIN78_08980 [Leeia sp. TBRC 13508]|uniref:Uncharacterized protein n=1 Tax=Leeia speluncae TaxID=2884804 RepID=A0ABS8D676_9NEIS|nr:hypothetical protein [Leeia speluncae]MCB6183682.1 hypothetical protein [Leeia speluncae]
MKRGKTGILIWTAEKVSAFLWEERLTACEWFDKQTDAWLADFQRFLTVCPNVTWHVLFTPENERWLYEEIPPVRQAEALKLLSSRMEKVDAKSLCSFQKLQNRLPDGRRDWVAWVGQTDSQTSFEIEAAFQYQPLSLISIHTAGSLLLSLSYTFETTLQVNVAVLQIEDVVHVVLCLAGSIVFKRELPVSKTFSTEVLVEDVLESVSYWQQQVNECRANMEVAYHFFLPNLTHENKSALIERNWKPIFDGAESLLTVYLQQYARRNDASGFLSHRFQFPRLLSRWRQRACTFFIFCVLCAAGAGYFFWLKSQSIQLQIDQLKRQSLLSLPSSPDQIADEATWQVRQKIISVKGQLQKSPSLIDDWWQLSKVIEEVGDIRLTRLDWSEDPVTKRKAKVQLDAQLICDAQLPACREKLALFQRQLTASFNTWQINLLGNSLTTSRSQEVNSEDRASSAHEANFTVELQKR